MPSINLLNIVIFFQPIYVVIEKDRPCVVI